MKTFESQKIAEFKTNLKPDPTYYFGHDIIHNDIKIVCLAAGGPLVLSDEPHEPSLIAPEPDGRKTRLDFIRKSIDQAKYLSSPVLNINSGKLKDSVSKEVAYKYFEEGIEHLRLELGELTLVLEPELGFLIATSYDAIEFIKRIDSSKLQLNLDIGHVFCSEKDCYENIDKALSYSRHIHIEDIKGNIHHHEIPGERDIDFIKIIDMIRKAEYKYYVSVERHHHDALLEQVLKESRDYLLRLM